MARKKKTKRVPKGSHRMPDGTIMKDKAMKRKRGRKVKKAPALNRQEPWFLGREYSSTSFTQLHQVNKYNHAVEGLEVLRGYTGRQNELDRRINEQRRSHADLYKRCALPAVNGQSMVCASQMDFGQSAYLPPVY